MQRRTWIGANQYTGTSVYDRFWSKAKKSIGCWLWQASRNKEGYGSFWFRDRWCKAHRVAWELTFGKPAPANKEVCHTCDTPSCVNPLHLFLGSHRENMDDMIRKGRIERSKGSANGRSKLTETNVLQIRALARAGKHKTARLSRIFGVSRTVIKHVVSRKSWKHV